MPSILSQFSGGETINERANKISEGRRRNELAEIAQPLKVQQLQRESRDANTKSLGQAAGIFLATIGDVAPDTPKEEINRRWLEGKQILSSTGLDMSKFPDQFSPEWLNAAKGLAGQAGSAAKIQSTFINDEGMRVAVFRDGSTKILGTAGINQKLVDGVLTNTVTGAVSLPGVAGNNRDVVLSEEQRQIQLAAEQKAAEEKAKLEQNLEFKPKIETAVGTAKQDVLRTTSEQTQAAKLPDARLSYNTLINADLSKIYGRGEGIFPDVLRSQEGIDLIAEKDKLLGMLKLGARGELKGQGPISDSETATLEQSVTTLSNPNISPEKARSALDLALGTLERSAGVDNLAPQSAQGGFITLPNGVKVRKVK